MLASDGTPFFRGTTDRDGLLRLPGVADRVSGAEWNPELRALVVASKDGDTGFAATGFDDSYTPWAMGMMGGWEGKIPEALGTVTPERGIYRPGDTVHFVGLARLMKLGRLGRPAAGTPVTVDADRRARNGRRESRRDAHPVRDLLGRCGDPEGGVAGLLLAAREAEGRWGPAGVLRLVPGRGVPGPALPGQRQGRRGRRAAGRPARCRGRRALRLRRRDGRRARQVERDSLAARRRAAREPRASSSARASGGGTTRRRAPPPRRPRRERAWSTRGGTSPSTPAAPRRRASAPGRTRSRPRSPTSAASASPTARASPCTRPRPTPGCASRTKGSARRGSRSRSN